MSGCALSLSTSHRVWKGPLASPPGVPPHSDPPPSGPLACAHSRATPRACWPSHRSCTVAQRLSAGIKLRLSYIEPYAASWPQALALQALPSQLPATVKRASLLAELLDDYAHATPMSAGASAGHGLGPVPPTACARRAAIGGAYALAELHMVADSAPASRAAAGADGGRQQPLDLSASYGHVDELCAALERGARSLRRVETELAHAAVHSRLLLGVLASLGRRG